MNILWITTDHQQWRTIAGRSACRTPNIQRLVDTGLTFNRAYTPMPVCCPVRAMWMSGAYPWHNGVHTQVHSAPSLTRDMFPDVVTYSQRLREAGYRQGFGAGLDNLAGVAERTMVLQREIRAPRALVWDAWTDPETLPRWWGPEGYSCRTKRIDLRLGERAPRVERVQRRAGR